MVGVEGREREERGGVDGIDGDGDGDGGDARNGCERALVGPTWARIR